MRKNRKIAAAVGAVLLILIIMIAAAAIRNGYPLKAVYLEKEDGDGIFVNLTAEYPFTGTIPEGELYDEAGGEITEQDLNSGDVVNIYGNGIMAESYPAQYHGITKIERTEQGTIPFWGNIGTARSRSRRAHLWKCRKMRTEIRNSRHSRDAYIWCRDNGKTVLWIMDSGCRRNKYSAPAKRTITDNELSIKSGEKNIWKQLLYTEAATERQKYMQRRWQRD